MTIVIPVDPSVVTVADVYRLRLRARRRQQAARLAVFTEAANKGKGNKGSFQPANPGRGTGRSKPSHGSPATSTTPDANWENVVVLAGFNGEDAAVAANNEKTGNPFSFVGTAQLDTSIKKFGASSLLLDGNSDYVTLPDGADWTPGDDEAFTWEAWVYPAAVDGTANTIMSHYEVTGARRSWSLRTKLNDTMSFLWSLDGTNLVEIVSDAAITVSTWEHWAVTRTALGTINMWRGGVKQTDEATSVTGAFHNSNALIHFGLEDNGSGLFWPGNLDEIRITQSVARYTENFTPPTLPFPRFGP